MWLTRYKIGDMVRTTFISDSFAELGEGLISNSKGLVAWLDINNNKIFTLREGVEQCFIVTSQATVIFRLSDCSLEFGSGSGISTLDFKTGVQHQRIDPPAKKRNDLRSNDGCFISGGRYLLGFMHPSDPANNPGQVFYYLDKAWHLIDDDIGIPNTFLEISESEFLISDSLLGVVWKYRVSESGQLLAKTPWMEFESGAPDGGCIYENFALIALWDGGCVSKIDLVNKERIDYPVPIPRPTNCAVDKNGSGLWVTSACEGLGIDGIRKAPLSGKTLCFEGLL